MLVMFPAIDIRVSQLFFDQGFYSETLWWESIFYDGLEYFLGASVLAVTAIYLFNRLAKRHWCGIDGKKVAYLFLVLIIGAGLIVNVAFKDNFGRARPRDIAEFGGAKQFTPAFIISSECSRNCSFSSGHGAGGFFALALAVALGRRRWLYVAGIGFGAMVSLSRIAAGAHFLSDSIVSFFVMLLVSDVLYHYMMSPAPERTTDALPLPVPH